MALTIENALNERGLKLLDAAAPAANYVPFVLCGRTLYVSGQISQTEAGPILTFNGPGRPVRAGTVGQPVARTEVRLVDPHDPDKLAPDGKAGEITARGPQIMKGYRNLPDQTAEDEVHRQHGAEDGLLHVDRLGRHAARLLLQVVDVGGPPATPARHLGERVVVALVADVEGTLAFVLIGHEPDAATG